MTEIKKYEKEKELLSSWDDDVYEAYSLNPNTARCSDELILNRNCIYMSSVQVGSHIEKVFGKASGYVDGRAGKAKFFAFDFKGNVIVAISEGGDIGTKWYWVTKNPGTRYGNPMLLSYDKEVKDFWPDFCEDFLQVFDYKDNKKIKMK